MVPGAATSLTTLAGKTVSRSFPANIGATDYIIEFNTDGSCIAVNALTGAQTVVAAAATFSAFPDMTVFASSRILIMDATGGYATWDGTLFVKSGGISPNIHITIGGSGYGAPPAVSFTGGAGGNAGGAAATGDSFRAERPVLSMSQSSKRKAYWRGLSISPSPEGYSAST